MPEPAKVQRAKINSAAHAIARSGEAGPWVAVKGQQTAANNTTHAIATVANSATLRQNIDMFKLE